VSAPVAAALVLTEKLDVRASHYSLANKSPFAGKLTQHLEKLKSLHKNIVYSHCQFVAGLTNWSKLMMCLRTNEFSSATNHQR
jgi:hypothetical protein